MSNASASTEMLLNSVPTEQNLPWRTRLGWGLGSMPLTVLNMAISVLLLRFMTDSLGIAAAMASLIFVIAKIWDAISDPLMGLLSDRIRTPWGQRLPWMLIGGVLSACAVVYLFSAPQMNASALLIYLLFGKLLYATAYTMFMVPYMTLPAELTKNYQQRTQLMSIRVVFSSIGTMIGLSAAPALLAYWGGGVTGHFNVSVMLASVAVVAVCICAWSLSDLPIQPVPTRKSSPSLKVQLTSALSNKPFLWLMSSKLSYFFVLTLSLSTFAYFTKHVLQVSDTVIGLYMGIQSITLIISQPFWLWVSKLLGKKNGYIVASALFGFAHFSWILAGQDEPSLLIVLRAIVIGIAGGGTFLLSQAMLPDALEYDQLKTGLDRKGAFTGFYVLIDKLAGALGVAFVGFFLAIQGYVESTDAIDVAQPDSAKTALYICIALIPFLMQFLSIFLISRYTLSEKVLLDLRAKQTSS